MKVSVPADVRLQLSTRSEGPPRYCSCACCLLLGYSTRSEGPPRYCSCACCLLLGWLPGCLLG